MIFLDTQYLLDADLSGANLTGGLNYSLSNDRFGTPNSALYLNNGFMKFPNGVYFDRTFTITIWVRLMTNYAQRILEFGNGMTKDNLILQYSNNQALTQIFSDTTNAGQYPTSSTLNLDTWYHLAWVVNQQNPNAFFYVNGVLKFKCARTTRDATTKIHPLTISSFPGQNRTPNLKVLEIGLINRYCDAGDIQTIHPMP